MQAWLSFGDLDMCVSCVGGAQLFVGGNIYI